MEAKEKYQETIYDALCEKLNSLDYVIAVDKGDVPVIATTKEGYCFWIEVKPCPYDWTKEEVESTLNEGK